MRSSNELAGTIILRLKKLQASACLVLLIPVMCPAGILDSLEFALANSPSTLDSIRILNELSGEIMGASPEKSLVYSQEALRSAKRIGFDLGAANALIRLGQYAHGEHQQEQALSYYNQAISLIDEIQYPRVAAEAYVMLGRLFTDMAQKRHESIEANRHALRIYDKLGDDYKVAVTANAIGYRFWRLAIYDSALVYYNQALEIRKQLPQGKELAQTTNNLGVLYYNTGNYEQALEYYLEAMRIHQASDKQYSVARLLSNIGKAYQDWGRPLLAMEHYQESLRTAQSIEDNAALGYAYNNIGSLHESNGNYDSAQVSYERSLECYQLNHHSEGVILNYNSLGHNFINLRAYDKALVYLNRARAASDSIGHPFGLVTALKYMGQAHLEQGKYGQALKDLEQGRLIAQRIGQRDVLKDIYKGLAQVYEASGLADSSLVYFKNFASLKDSLYSEQTSRNINSLKIRYQTERNERENAVLRDQEKQQSAIIERDKIIIIGITAMLAVTTFLILLLFRLNQSRKRNNVLLRQSEDKYRRIARELGESDSLRELLLDIITHDLKNSAGVIYSMSEYVRAELPDNELIESIYLSSERLLAVLNNTTVLSQAAFGENIPKEPLELNKILQEIRDDFSSALEEAGMEIEINVSPNVIINANPLIGEVFKNYISNAIKYAQDGKNIVIEAKFEKTSLVVSVIDFGQTIAEANRDSIFERRIQLGEGKKTGRGLGLAIVKRIASAHHGEVWVEPHMPTGNTFSLRLPL